MKSFLPYVVLFDVERNGPRYRFRHRLTGSHFMEIFGHEVTGKYMGQTGAIEDIRVAHQRLSRIVDEKALVYGISPSPARERVFLHYEHLTLPLASDIDRLAIEVRSAHGPRRLSEGGDSRAARAVQPAVHDSDNAFSGSGSART